MEEPIALIALIERLTNFTVGERDWSSINELYLLALLSILLCVLVSKPTVSRSI